ncbi:4-oxalmesaconate hydratase [Arthrobacter ginsengisoli]|uniref:4-oxalmesaconate hydratase n=1 Tax=Arthrobacter ginsengisoli TaxID=1356565 RepID=A0ABU1UDQ2_9MICC|nr:amidohydrolase family protein [Arthrobacter ginsengisoli]MDR7083265.1 4-oxalmesaconate hydratase [Arthrobacter ginsengisoli]
MIIDIHGHVSSPAELYAYRSILTASRGAHGREGVKLNPDQVLRGAERHVGLLDRVGTDVQFISPRPFQLMHAENPSEIVFWWTRAANDAVAAQVAAFPERFRGIAALPQAVGTEPSQWLDELERTVLELGFIGVLINPDPAEGQNLGIPRIGDEWWYPLFAKLEELGIPALIHAAGCRDPRENYSEHMITEASRTTISLANSRVFEHFPNLSLIVSHGGGSVPYQIGRWRAARYLEYTQVESYDNKDSSAPPEIVSFDESLRQMYFDSLVHDRNALALLVQTVGADRVMLGTEVPGSGSPIDPLTGFQYDDITRAINSYEWLGDDDRTLILKGTARRLYTRF